MSRDKNDFKHFIYFNSLFLYLLYSFDNFSVIFYSSIVVIKALEVHIVNLPLHFPWCFGMILMEMW